MVLRIVAFILTTCFLFTCKSDDYNNQYKVFHYNQPNPITSLDPAFARAQNNIWAVNHIFNGLVQLDDSLNIKPCIAKYWDISSDAKTYTFHLRTDIQFHDNELFKKRNLNAHDVQYSFARLIDPEIRAAGSWVFSGKVTEENPFIALNDSTFQLNLKEPFVPMLNILSMQYCSIIPKEIKQWTPQKFSRNPIGTGPFKFKRWIEGKGLYLIKNEHYFESNHEREIPKLDGVRTSFISDKKIAFLELLNGNIDAVSGLESSFINELLDREGNLLEKQKNKIQFYKNPYLNLEYLGFNLEAFPDNHCLQKKKVRQALNYAIDRKTMLESIRNNVGKPADSGAIPRGLPSYSPKEIKGYSYNIQKAVQLLADAGYPSGKGMEKLEIFTNKDYLDLTTVVAKSWENIGVKVQVKLLESATLRERMRKGTLGIFRASWIADYPDGESFLCLFYSDYPAPPNYTRFKNQAFDQLYQKAIKEQDKKARLSLYNEMNSIVVEEAPMIFLFYDEVALFTSNKIQGVSKNALNLLKVKELNEE